MFRHILFVLLVSCQATVASSTGHVDQNAPLRVHVRDSVGIPSKAIELAETEASYLLRTAVRVTWINCQVIANKLCNGEVQKGDIIIRVIPHAPTDIKPTILGVALNADPGVFATIFYDRVSSMAHYGVPFDTIASKVMAREITSLLLGENNDRATGVMRARWSVDDFRMGNMSRWFYTPQQQVAMREQLAHRIDDNQESKDHE